MKNRIWVIEQYNGHSKWVPLKIDELGEISGSTNFYDAHQLKRELTDAFFDLSCVDVKRYFRVQKYVRSE